MRRVRLVLLMMLLFAALPAVQAQDAEPPHEILTLLDRAVLPAATFAEGPASGAALSGPINGIEVPFDSQPVQGVSSILPADNGFGAKGNSADYILRFHEVAVDFEAGTVTPVGFTQLSDPDKLIPFPITNNDSADRLLTGADFDLESFRRAPDGTLWFGEEFGPYLLHTDAEGNLLEAPIPTPYPKMLAEFARELDLVQSPEHPDFVGLADQDARAYARWELRWARANKSSIIIID